MGPKCGGDKVILSITSKTGTGQGPQLDNKAVDTWGYGELGRRWKVTGGSPEHQLLKEARALKPKGSNIQARQETKDRAKGEPQGRDTGISSKGEKVQKKLFEARPRKGTATEMENSTSESEASRVERKTGLPGDNVRHRWPQ